VNVNGLRKLNIETGTMNPGNSALFKVQGSTFNNKPLVEEKACYASQFPI
jgi:hypothetical protein